MTIILYKCKSDRRVVSKSIYGGVTKTLALRGDLNVMSPEWVIDGDSTNFYSGYNYAYCPDLKRYYFIYLDFKTGGLVSLRGEVDVLMTYSNAIRGLTALVARQEFVYNPYFNDESLPVATNGYIKTSDVGAVTSTANTIYLTCIGGIEST